MGQGNHGWRLNGTLQLQYALNSDTREQGGGIAAAFTSQYPYLVDDRVVLIASAGIMQVSSLLFIQPAHLYLCP